MKANLILLIKLFPFTFYLIDIISNLLIRNYNVTELEYKVIKDSLYLQTFFNTNALILLIISIETLLLVYIVKLCLTTKISAIILVLITLFDYLYVQFNLDYNIYENTRDILVYFGFISIIFSIVQKWVKVHL